MVQKEFFMPQPISPKDRVVGWMIVDGFELTIVGNAPRLIRPEDEPVHRR